MLKISRLTDYAVMLLGHMAKNPEYTFAAAEIADATGVAMPTASKILKALTRARIVRSTRGAKGGYALACLPERTSVAAIIYALEGPIALTECESGQGGCSQSASCDARGSWEVINRAVRAALESVSLADMARPVAKAPEEFRIPVSSIQKPIKSF